MADGTLAVPMSLLLATVPGPWSVHSNGLHVFSEGADILVFENFDDPGPWHRALPAHITRWDPAAVLRQVAAHRKIIDEWADVQRALNFVVARLAEAYGIDSGTEAP